MKRSLHVFLALALILSASLSTVGHAATIVIQNNDGAGEGFNDPTPAAPVGGNTGTTLGQQRLIAFTYAANIWAACLQSSVPIIVRAQMDPLFCDAGSAVLGSAGATTVHRDFVGAPLAATWYSQALANSLFGADLSAAQPDINATFNSTLTIGGPCLGGLGWYLGLDQNAGANFDFVTVLVHEIGHGVGFQTFVAQNGTRFLGFNDQYMVFMESHFAVPPGYPAMTDAQRMAANIADPNLHWNGPLVTAKGASILSAGISNGHVRLHGPNPFQGGSSLSHWSTALTPNEIMEPFYTAPNHEPNLAWTLMDEIGWTIINKVTDGCAGAVLDLEPPTGVVGSAPDDNQERGVYVTALKDFSLCSIGMEASLFIGETIRVRVYEATGTTRGPLLASGVATVEFAGMRTHYVPISYTLQACEEYDITFEFQNTIAWPWWDENTMTRPYDVGGVIRVRDGEWPGGNATNFALAHFTLQGGATFAQIGSTLGNAPFLTFSDGSTNRGAFIKAAKTISLCSVSFAADYPGSPVKLTANIYNAVGLVRGSLLATGTTETSAAGFQFHGMRTNAVLHEGRDYEIEVLYPVPIVWGGYSEGFAPVPFTVDGAITVVNGTESGNPSNTILPQLRVAWNEGPGLDPLDINGPWLGTPAGSSTLPAAFGKYVSATHNQELTALGFYADLAPGATMTANVYRAIGATRGPLVSTGTITTGPAGLRWHDIPVSATLVDGSDYDLEVDWSATTPNGFPYWANVGGQQPYNVYGLMDIVVGEFGGIPDAATECVQMRIYSCATGPLTPAGPAVTPRFTLSDAYPNPFSGSATMGFTLDEATAVSVTVYDVAGRRVADVMKSRSLPAGPGEIAIDAKNLASGVYFVKLSTPSKSVTRKITIIR